MKLYFAAMLSILPISLLAQSTSDLERMYESSDVIFIGSVTKVESNTANQVVTFEVDQQVKGNIPKELQGVESPTTGKCGRFKERHAYLVYAKQFGSTYSADFCEGSKLAASAEQDLRYLHTKNPAVSERCNAKHLSKLWDRSSTVVLAEVIGTETTLGTSDLLFRPWCGITWFTEDAFYRTLRVLKGEIDSEKFIVEHPICWDTVTVNGEYPELSPTLFKSGNTLLLFIEHGSNLKNRKSPSPFSAVFKSNDLNCGAVLADDQVTAEVIESQVAQSAVR